MICDRLQDGQVCGQSVGVRLYLPGPRCPACTPAKVAGKLDHTPDPELALEAIAARAGRPVAELGPQPLTPREGVVKASRTIRRTRKATP